MKRDISAVEVHGPAALLHIHRADDPDVPAPDFLVVVVPDLHDLVMFTELHARMTQEGNRSRRAKSR